MTASAYDQAVLADNPVAFYRMIGTYDREEYDDAGPNGPAEYGGDVIRTLMPNGDDAAVFDGESGYLEIPDFDALSVTTTGILTIEAWLRPDTLQFPKQESTGYVHWLGKGTPGQHEYVMRMYSKTTTDAPARPNRISGYAFNAIGGLGAGSYFQDLIEPGRWIHVALQIDTVAGIPVTRIFKNGVLRDTDALAGYNITPSNGSAPLRIGTRDFKSFFLSAIGKVAIYNYALSVDQQIAHCIAMAGPVGP